MQSFLQFIPFFTLFLFSKYSPFLHSILIFLDFDKNNYFQILKTELIVRLGFDSFSLFYLQTVIG